jgi:hypothetical protein
LSEMPLGQVPEVATVALPVAPSVAAAPLTVSFAAMLAMGVEAMPETPEPLSATATIFAATLMVSVAVAQSGGAFLSQS